MEKQRKVERSLQFYKLRYAFILVPVAVVLILVLVISLI